MNQIINVLIIDDHPLIIDAYKSALSHISSKNENLKFFINSSENCDDADLKIKEAKKGIPIDLVLLDISLPPSKDRKILSGEDLGVKLRHFFKTVKLIVMTSYNDNYRLNNILKNLNPEGFLVKDDVSFQSLVDAIVSVINDIPFYSKTITKLIRRHISNDFVLDNIDRQMLYHLSMGAKMKDLGDIIPLSNGGIERRKRLLKEKFNLLKKDDWALIEQAKEKGFI